VTWRPSKPPAALSSLLARREANSFDSCVVCSRLVNCAIWAMNAVSSIGFKRILMGQLHGDELEKVVLPERLLRNARLNGVRLDRRVGLGGGGGDLHGSGEGVKAGGGGRRRRRADIDRRRRGGFGPGRGEDCGYITGVSDWRDWANWRALSPPEENSWPAAPPEKGDDEGEWKTGSARR
jgi:hypothetical protein